MFQDKKPQGLKHLFKQSDVGTRQAQGMLARLWRKILCDRLGSHHIFTDTGRLALYSRLVDAFVKHPRNGIQNDRAKQATMKGNLAKQLLHDRMSPDVFLTQLQIWRCQGFELVIRPIWEDGTQTEHSITVTNLMSPDEPELPSGVNNDSSKSSELDSNGGSRG